MNVSFTYRFNVYKAANDKVCDEIKATHALFGDDLNFLEESKVVIDKWLNENIKNLDKYKRCFSNKTIAFFGDSLTSDKLGYRSLIERSGVFKEVIDFSISGSNSTDCFKIVARNAKQGLSDIAIIFIGTNDAMEYSGLPLVDENAYYRNLSNSIKILKDKGINVKLINVPYMAFEGNKSFILKFNDVINNLSMHYNLDVFDLNKLLINKSCHEPDGVHLLPEFHVLLCKEFMKWLYEKNY